MYIYVRWLGINEFAGVFDSREAAMFATQTSEGWHDEYDGDTYACKEHGYKIEKMEVRSFATMLRDRQYEVNRVRKAAEKAGQSLPPEV